MNFTSKKPIKPLKNQDININFFKKIKINKKLKTILKQEKIINNQ